MKHFNPRRLSLLHTLIAGAVVTAASPALAADTTLSVRTTPGHAGRQATAVVRGETGSPFAIFARPESASARVVRLATGFIDSTGMASHTFPLPDGFAGSDSRVEFVAFVSDQRGWRIRSNPTVLELSSTPYEMFSADHHIGSDLVLPGEVLAEQWSDRGMHVSCVNHLPGPNKVVAFDSSEPTGEDPDLATPGPGSGNNFAFSNVMIIAENDVDMNGDGLVDDPDDDRFGGIMTFEWDDPVVFSSVTLLDVDTTDVAGAVVRTYLRGMLIESRFVPGLDDNNVQVIAFADQLIDELEVDFSGSGAVAEVAFLPCPVVVNFDETTMGIPLQRQAGEIVADQFLSQGVRISGVTNDPAHPDEVLLFDTGNPTGGDTDLVTPGPGVNNTEARGLALVLADNVIDLDGDGLVDDPGDSANGGTFTIDFELPVMLHSATVLDIDMAEPACFLEAFDGNGISLGTWPLAELGDNSVQVVDFGSLPMVRRLEMTVCASGALTDLVFCPAPNSM